MNGWLKWMDEWIHMNGSMDEWINGCKHECMDAWIDG